MYASAISPVSLGFGAEEPDQFDPGADAELHEDVAHVVVDRARAQVELGGDLAVGGAPGDDLGDRALLGGERFLFSGGAEGFAGRAEFAAAAVGPGHGAEPFERVV